MEKIHTSNFDDNNPEQKEKTFNKLQRIQNLLKRESALKKLCKKILINIYYLIYSYKSKRPNKERNRETM